VSKFLDFIGTTAASFKIAIGGVLLKNSSGNLLVRNTTDAADAAITASQLNNSGDQLVLNSDAAASGADWAVTFRRSPTGMTANYTYTLPISAGSPGQVQSTDGSGNTSWITIAAGADKISSDTTNLAFGTASPLTLFTLPINAVVEAVSVTVDTAFNGTPSLSIGITGTTSKYMASTQVDLTAVATTIFEVYPGRAAIGTTEALIATYSAGAANAGAARIEIDYVVPS